MGSSRHIFFLSHGGGPLPLLGDAGHAEMLSTLQQVAAEIPKPSAIIVISAHWEASQPVITGAAQPELIYDYYGFPEASYEITYPASGNPELAKEVFTALENNDLQPRLDTKRGFDHGLFIPLKIMYPQADIPCLQVSLLDSLDPQAHIRMGNALAELRHDNLLFIGSGFSFHNMRAFFTPNSVESEAKNTAFEQWLIETCSSTELNEEQRAARLLDWQSAPHARYCHPREEHLLPLHVCYGIAGRACDQALTLNLLDKQASMYLWS